MRQPWSRENRCLGDKAAALTDGELGQQARDAALSHLVHCDGCRDDVAGQRRLKARLAELTEPLPPAGLLDRLQAIGAAAALEPLPSSEPVLTGRGVRRPHLTRAAQARDHTRPRGRSRRGVRYVIGGGVSVLALGVSAFALGGGAAAPTVVPVGSSSVEYASTPGEVPFGAVPPVVSFRRVLVSSRP